MIARLTIVLPFHMVIPEDEQIDKSIEYQDYDCLITIYPPKKDQMKERHEDLRFTMNGANAKFIDTLVIDFKKNSFNRNTEFDWDPSTELMIRTINEFLSKYRTVSKQPKIEPKRRISHSWNLIYLNDDESAIEKEDGMIRTISGGIDLPFVGMNNNVWHDIEKLGTNFTPPIWQTLLYDAISLMPQIGPPIVLAHSALEVYIPTILDRLAIKNQVPDELWKWMNNRNHRNPDIKEQYDSLLKIMLGKSLKENNELWEGLSNLTKARNSFLHEGESTIDGVKVKYSDVWKLLKHAEEIIDFVEINLTNDMQWSKYYNHNIDIDFIFDDD